MGVDGFFGDEGALRFYTPLVIWSNYDLPNVPNNDQLFVGSQYLGALVCKLAGVEMTKSEKLLLDLYEYMPAFNKYYYFDSDMNYVESYEELNNTEIVDLIRAMTYQQLKGINKSFYWDILSDS